MMNKTNFRIAVVILVLVAAYLGFDRDHGIQSNNEPSSIIQTETQLSTDDSQKILQAFQQQQSNVQVQASGRVKAILADDQ
jgi:hypothetical protein